MGSWIPEYKFGQALLSSHDEQSHCYPIRREQGFITILPWHLIESSQAQKVVAVPVLHFIEGAAPD